MKIEGGLLINMSSELANYFKGHPAELPASVDVNALEVRTSSYLIEHIENYTRKPFTDKFLWCVVFPKSKNPLFEYFYFIDYKAVHKGEHGIVSAKLMYENKDYSSAWYSAN